MSPQNALPSLVFGEALASQSGDPRVAARQSAKTITALEHYRPKGSGSFLSKSVNLCINGLNICANASTPLRAEMAPSSDLYFIISFIGDCFTQVSGRKYAWSPHSEAILIPRSGSRYGESCDRSIIIARLDEDRIIRTANAMRGADAKPIETPLDEIRKVALNYGSIDFGGAFYNIAKLIDNYSCNEAALSSISVDDLFYRQLAMALFPEELVAQLLKTDVRAPARGVIDELCDLIGARLGRPCSMTEMEAISGLSRRSLQDAFNRRFGCAPMEWQRRERLRAARRLLHAGGQGEQNIADLAFRLGFSSPSRFAKYYRAMYGEAPTDSIRRLGD